MASPAPTTAAAEPSIESIYASMSDAERLQFVQYHSYNNFKQLHTAQLQALQIPESLWETVYKKCYDIEAALAELEQLFAIQLVEETVESDTDVKTDDVHSSDSVTNVYYQAVAQRDIQPLQDVYVLPHAWQTTEQQLLPQLRTLEGLLERLWQQSNIQHHLLKQHTQQQIDNLTLEQKCNILLKYLFEQRYMQQYLTTIPKSKTQRVTELQPADVVHNYYVDNEYGTAMQQTTDNAQINARLENFVCITQDGIAVSLLWFTKQVAAEQLIVIAQKPVTPCPLQLNTEIASVAGAAEVDDVQVIASTANVSIEQAREALQKYGNVTDAIVELDSQSSRTA